VNLKEYRGRFVTGDEKFLEIKNGDLFEIKNGKLFEIKNGELFEIKNMF
jgi:hypothetical protein